MAKKSSIEHIENKLQEHLEQMEQLFPLGMCLTVIGISQEGWHFVLGDGHPDDLIECVNRAYKKSAPKKAAKKKATKR